MPDIYDACVFGAWLVGGFVSGVSGIGGAMVAFPLLALFIPVHQLIPLTCILNVVMDGCLAAMHCRHCRGSALWPMLAGSIPGSFAGLYILQICSGAVLQGAVGLLLIFGGDMIFGFSLALVIGIVFGTFSSIYVASTWALFLKIERKNLIPKKIEKKEIEMESMDD